MKSDERYARFIAECCAALEVDVEDVLSRSREHGPVMNARFLLTYLLRKNFGLSYPCLARVLKRQDHTTCISAFRKFERLVEARDRRALYNLARVAGIDRPLSGLEGPLDSLRYCDSAPLELEAVG